MSDEIWDSHDFLAGRVSFDETNDDSAVAMCCLCQAEVAEFISAAGNGICLECLDPLIDQALFERELGPLPKPKPSAWSKPSVPVQPPPGLAGATVEPPPTPTVDGINILRKRG